MPSLTKQRTRVTILFSNGELNDLLINSMIHSFESLLVYCLTGKLAERLAVWFSHSATYWPATVTECVYTLMSMRVLPYAISLIAKQVTYIINLAAK